jgi:hypothetical protein
MIAAGCSKKVAVKPPPGRRASATASVIILVHTASGMPDQATMNQIQRW